MYQRQSAVDYALKWALKQNPDYYDFSKLGGDCTNFISQCIYSGKVLMNYAENGWFYANLNSRSPSWTGVNELWDFGVQNSGGGVRIRECALSEVELGDIIQLSNGIRFYHTLIVTSFSGGIKVCAHDKNVRNVPLYAYNFVKLRCGKIIN